MSRLIPPPFGSLHPVIPSNIVMVLDLDNPNTLVELQDQPEGRIKEVILTDWHIEGGNDSDPGPYFQLKFSQGIEIRTLSFGPNVIHNAIQVPWRGRKKEIPIIRTYMIPRIFRVELFGADSLPLNFERCVLWFMIRLE